MAEQSSKAMYVLQYLWQNTDDEHSATTSDIVNSASKSGIAINRHSVPVIIEQLQHLGYDIIVIAGSPNKYFIGAREFELPELKLLIDAIESSRFISEKKSNELTEKSAGWQVYIKLKNYADIYISMAELNPITKHFITPSILSTMQ